MRWWWCAVTLAACESTADFPGPPGDLDWSTMELAVHRSKLDGTEYQIDLPRAVVEQVVDRTARLGVYALSVTIELDREARVLDDIDRSMLGGFTLRDDGWSATENSGATVLNYVYVDEGGLLCRASVASATPSQTERMQQICGSLRATSALANPLPYAEGLTPSKLHAAGCQLALEHARSYENVGRISKAKKTKDQRAADARREEKLDAEYRERQLRCERHRWPSAELRCIAQTRGIEKARECVASGW